MATKTPIESKYIWFNGLSIVALVVTDLMANDAFRDALGGKIFYVMIAGSVINMVLRFYTTKPIKIKRSEPPATIKNKHQDILDAAMRKDAEDNGLV